MHPRDTITRQIVSEEKLAAAKRLRREQTPTEAALWERLRRSQLQGLHFRRQQVILGFVVDFYCHAAAVIVEIDGAIHDTQVEADAQRQQVLEGAGFRVIRFTTGAVSHDIEAVLRRIAGFYIST
jgi:very-short-patch-repair endonuclease